MQCVIVPYKPCRVEQQHSLHDWNKKKESASYILVIRCFKIEDCGMKLHGHWLTTYQSQVVNQWPQSFKVRPTRPSHIWLFATKMATVGMLILRVFKTNLHEPEGNVTVACKCICVEKCSLSASHSLVSPSRLYTHIVMLFTSSVYSSLFFYIAIKF